jgi:phage tail-like protein
LKIQDCFVVPQGGTPRNDENWTFYEAIKYLKRLNQEVPMFCHLLVRSTIMGIGFLLLTMTTANAAEFSVNTHRFDPYKQFKFRVKWDGRYVAGITKVSGLHRETEVISNREGTEPSIMRKSPGKTAYKPIILERGRTHDTEFEKWAHKVYNFGAGLGSESSLKDFRKDIIIELYNEAGQLVMAWKVYRCWPSKYSPLNEFNANSTQVAIESMVLEHEGWERDMEVRELMEPSFTKP